MLKKLFRILLIGLICTNLNIITIFSNTNATGYAPCDDEILPVDTITTGDKALSDINIRIFQPFFNEMDETTSSIVGHELPNGIISDAQCPVAPVKTFQNTYGALIKTIRTYNKPTLFRFPLLLHHILLEIFLLNRRNEESAITDIYTSIN